MPFLRKLNKNSLSLRDFSCATFSLDLDAIAKTFSSTNIIPKIWAKTWNQDELGYFDPNLDKAHRKDEIVSIGKDE